MTAPDFDSGVFAGWREATPDWAAYTRHAFVEGLRTGALPRAAFMHYLVQDYVFLVHFSRAWALAVVKAGSLAEMRTAAATVDALVNHEMRLHVETCAKAGITEDALFAAEEAPENLAYTRFVIDAGLSGDFLDLMAALAPCVLGYGEIGARLAREATSDAYADWIGTYGGEEYQSVCAEVGGLIDAAAAARLGAAPEASPRWPALCRRFATATRLEVGFWDMGLRGHP
ncbi:TenA family protein [Limibaculum sp. FT325]|uniref:TenA family protein n=1 Tax=Thermohalobaculum sediminis TaxID=2939436 RepID=UPI0020BEB90D|nr:TenA family protein [Limibaculum sediminis]MCL5776000.1 TenA family protein [Limibaculum sediminis]